MGITERREREKEEVRRKILDAARELFASEGYERVTMRRIAEAIEYSPTTIYHHYEDKDDLVKALCDEDFGKLFLTLSAAPMPADPIEVIRRLGLAYCQFGLDHPNHYRFMFMTPHEESQKVEPDDPGSRSFEVLRSAVVRAIEAGRLRREDPDLVAQVLWASIHGAVALLITTRPDQTPCAMTPAALIPAVVDNSLRGFLTD
jgi:AcrR family transcriptional regulator